MKRTNAATMEEKASDNLLDTAPTVFFPVVLQPQLQGDGQKHGPNERRKRLLHKYIKRADCCTSESISCTAHCHALPLTCGVQTSHAAAEGSFQPRLFGNFSRLGAFKDAPTFDSWYTSKFFRPNVGSIKIFILSYVEVQFWVRFFFFPASCSSAESWRLSALYIAATFILVTSAVY